MLQFAQTANVNQIEFMHAWIMCGYVCDCHFLSEFRVKVTANCCAGVNESSG